ncbi:MAG: murein hydrolase activator EnvC family protein [Gemmatimonadales bacterium]
MLLLLCVLCVSAPLRLSAQGTVQQRMRASQQKLSDIRAERERLRQQREDLQGQAHDAQSELTNISRQRDATNRVVNELDRQIGGLNQELDQVSTGLALAQDNLADKRAVLERRLVEIYKRGLLYDFQALLAAESFGDLVSRFKYLFLTSRQDRQLVSDVERLRDKVARQRTDLVTYRESLGRSRIERDQELQHYGELAEEQRSRLREVNRSTRSTDNRLTALQRDEAQLNDLLASLERARREAAARAAAAASASGRRPVAPTASISTASIGKLGWPVEGTLLYGFGKDELDAGGIIRHNGIGIAVPPGTPVKAVEAGTVVLVAPYGTYGLTIVISHGGGYYSLYSQLTIANVTANQIVTKGQVIATSGGANSDEGPHLYFEIRGENGVALDPTEWLQRRK